jgi:hypothetical protein
MCFVFSRPFVTSAPTCQKTKQKKIMEVHELLGHRIIGLFINLILVGFLDIFFNITKGQDSAASHGNYPDGHIYTDFLMVWVPSQKIT